MDYLINLVAINLYVLSRVQFGTRQWIFLGEIKCYQVAIFDSRRSRLLMIRGHSKSEY